MKTYQVTVYDDGRVEWRFEGLLHRENGPAIEWADGTKSWLLNGVQLTEQEHAQKTRAKKTCLVIDGKEIEVSSETIENLKKALGV